MANDEYTDITTQTKEELNLETQVKGALVTQTEPWLSDAPGPSCEKWKQTDIEEFVDVKPDMKIFTTALEQDSGQDAYDDDSDFDIKKEDLEGYESESDGPHHDYSWKKESNTFQLKQEFMKQDLSDQNESEMECSKEDYGKIININFTSLVIKEEPVENLASIFKKSPLKSEKGKFHQQILEKLFEKSTRPNLKNLQDLYIDQLRKAANIEIFSCSLCNYETMNIINLKCHLFLIHNAKSKSNVFECNHCGYKANFQCNIIKHLLSHGNLKKKYSKKKKKYPCKEFKCTYKARSEESLNRHSKCVHNLKTNSLFQCNLCTFEALDEDSLKEHDLTHKVDKNRFQCYMCEYHVKSRMALAIHLFKVHKMQTKMSEKSKICDQCSMICPSSNHLEKHLLTHKELSELSEGDIYNCSQCPYKSKYKYDLKTHNEHVHSEPKYICETCGFAIKYCRTYEEHLLSHKKWEEIEWFKCHLCPFQSKTKRNLYKHIKKGSHNKNRKPKINPEAKKKKEKTTCGLCTLEVDIKNHNEHMATHKEGNRWKCFKCDYKQTDKLQVGIHLQEVHQFKNEASKKAKICEICSKSFSNTHHLKRHQICHKDISDLSENEIYKCSKCEKKFKQERTLQIHLLTHQDPQLVCKICGFATRHKKNFHNHQTLHLDEDKIKWHKCDLCPYQGRNRKLLWQHRKKGDHSDKYRPAHLRRSRKYESDVGNMQDASDEARISILRLQDIFPHSIF